LDSVRSFVALFAYMLLLPILALVGHHLFMKYLEKTFHHFGRIMTIIGFNVAKDEYVTD